MQMELKKISLLTINQFITSRTEFYLSTVKCACSPACGRGETWSGSLPTCPGHLRATLKIGSWSSEENEAVGHAGSTDDAVDDPWWAEVSTVLVTIQPQVSFLLFVIRAQGVVQAKARHGGADLVFLCVCVCPFFFLFM